MDQNRELVARFIETLDRRDWESWCAVLVPDVVYEVPQTRERVRGRDRYLRFNQEYPGDWRLSARRVIADESNGVAWFVSETPGEPTLEAVAFFTFEDGLISTVTDFWPEPYEPPPGREHLVERW